MILQSERKYTAEEKEAMMEELYCHDRTARLEREAHDDMLMEAEEAAREGRGGSNTCLCNECFALSNWRER